MKYNWLASREGEDMLISMTDALDPRHFRNSLNFAAF